MNLPQAAFEVGQFLEGRGIRYFVIGGFALQQWGEPRLTRDVDITVLVHTEDLEPFVDAVLEKFTSRIPDARAFALRHRVVLVEASSVPVDLSLGIPGYEDEVWERAVWIEFPGMGRLRLVGPEDLIIHKCVAGRPRDVEDVEGVLVRQRLKLNLELIRGWLDEFRPVVDTHDPRDAFEKAFARAQEAMEEGA